MQNMHIQVLRNPETKYYYSALSPHPVHIRYDYTKDFRDRLRKAQAWNRGNSLIYSSR